MDQIKQMIEAIKSNEGFRQKVQDAENIQEKIEIAGEYGYHFSVDELKNFQKELQGYENELGDTDLDRVAGGSCGMACSGEECHSAQNCFGAYSS